LTIKIFDFIGLQIMYEHIFFLEFYGDDPTLYLEPSFSTLSNFPNDFLFVYVVNNSSLDLHKIEIPPNVVFLSLLDPYPNRFNRFAAIELFEAKYYHFRDSDSAFTERELSLISLISLFDSDVFVFRDHELHFSPILAGLVTISHSIKAMFLKKLLSYKSSKFQKYEDQFFLTSTLYNKELNLTAFSSSYFYSYDNDKVVIAPVDKFLGMPSNWDKPRHDCKIYHLPFFISLSRLYQRYKFIWVLKFFSGFR
jgi:hypothetical protein